MSTCLPKVLYLYDMFHHKNFAMVCIHQHLLNMQIFHKKCLCRLHMQASMRAEANPSNFEPLTKIQL